MRERSHPEQGFRASVGIIRLVKSYGRERSSILAPNYVALK